MADDNKTELPTWKRVDKAREGGSFVSSREIVTAGNFLVFLFVVNAWFPTWLATMKAMLRLALQAAFHSELNATTLPGLILTLLSRSFLPLAILAGLSMATSLAIQLKVTGMGISFGRFTPDIGRFNPLGKISGMFSQAPGNVTQAAAMLVIFGWTIYVIAKQNAEIFLSLPFASLDISLQTVAVAMKSLLWKAGALFLVLGFIDLFRQRKKYTKGLKMTKQEVKQERKEEQTSPEVKRKIRQFARDLLRQRMMKQVPTASVVIVNPTHFAVALRYGHGTNTAPVVVAKGKNYLALRIRKLATDSGVPLVENKPLAQALYKTVDVGQEIPPNLYRAVAEVLAYIHRLTNLHRQRSTKRGPGMRP
jgi:flagellar biosynthetic protein FlhB